MTERNEKVKLAIIDKDLKVRTFKEFPLTSDGTKIDVVKTGKGYFRPKINSDSAIELPIPSINPFAKPKWEKIYIARRGASQCFVFRKENEPALPDPQEVMNTARAEMLQNWGKEKIEIHPIFYFMLLVLLGIAAKVFGVIA
jgi:hypothetical protein